MELDQFVKDALLGILKGVAKAQEDAELGKHVGPTFRFEMGHQKDHRGVLVHGSHNHTIVEFDVAVTSETSTTGKGGIKVLGLGGADAGVEHSRGSASRIKFSVPILLPQIKGT